MASNPIGDPWRTLPILLENRRKYGNIYDHRYLEHIEDTEVRDKMDTSRGKKRTWIELHTHAMMVHSIMGIFKLEGTRVTCNVWAQGVHIWKCVA